MHNKQTLSALPCGQLVLDRVTPGAGVTPACFFAPDSQSRLQDILILNSEILFCIMLALLLTFTPDLWFLSSEVSCTFKHTYIYVLMSILLLSVTIYPFLILTKKIPGRSWLCWRPFSSSWNLLTLHSRMLDEFCCLSLPFDAAAVWRLSATVIS